MQCLFLLIVFIWPTLQDLQNENVSDLPYMLFGMTLFQSKITKTGDRGLKNRAPIGYFLCMSIFGQGKKKIMVRIILHHMDVTMQDST